MTEKDLQERMEHKCASKIFFAERDFRRAFYNRHRSDLGVSKETSILVAEAALRDLRVWHAIAMKIYKKNY